VPFFEPRELGEKPWGTETLVGHVPDLYTAKVLLMRANESGPLQYHEQKNELFHLWAGKLELTLEIDGKLIKRPMRAGQSFHVPPGTVHRVKALRTSVIFEASTPVFDDRVNVEDRFRDDPNF
jgi:mannose-6-phosphate isomerase-like protein (cupin superfamily)